jgi:hypothetical protein
MNTQGEWEGGGMFDEHLKVRKGEIRKEWGR